MKIGVVLVAGVLAAPVLSFTHSVILPFTHSVIHPFPQSPIPPLQNGCAWSPPKTAHTVTIKHAFDLGYLLPTVKKGTTVLLEDGEYTLDSTADISVPGTVVRSKSGNAAKVVIRGGGMTSDKVGVALSVSAPDVTIADLTVGNVVYHAIQVRGERAASRVLIHNVHLVDSGQQLLKGSVSNDGQYADDGIVECSRFSYTDTAPSDYTNGVDLLATKGWIIRDNVFERIRGPVGNGYKAGPAIMAWANSQDTLIERNLIVESFRGIALGLGPSASSLARAGETGVDHQRGLVRNNVVCNPAGWTDEAIEANGAVDFRIEHNTVLTGSVASPWSIGVRFPTAHGIVRNNLTSMQILARNGGRPELESNVITATAGWFVDAKACDLHLSPAARGAIDAGVVIPDVPLDFDRQPRAGAPDAGAFEFRGGVSSALRSGRRP